MKMATIEVDGRPALATVADEEVVDLTVAAPELPATMEGLLALGRPGLERVQEAIDGGGGRLPLAEASFLAPVRTPRKFFGVGLNYASHVAETSRETPEFPTVFSKATSCLAGPHDDVVAPAVSDQLDYEGELGFVIGRRCRHVGRERAAEAIGGYFVANDFSVRDFQMRTPQWDLGKSFDTHGPIGPWIVTAGEIDPHSLPIRTLVNGEVRQEANTAELIFDCFDLVALLSTVCTLFPGDLIVTGTPGGIGALQGKFLGPGDVVRVEIDGIGAIENRIVPDEAAREYIEEPTTGTLSR